MRVHRGARCGNSARRDLRGGHWATSVPTSICKKMLKHAVITTTLIILAIIIVNPWNGWHSTSNPNVLRLHQYTDTSKLGITDEQQALVRQLSTEFSSNENQFFFARELSKRTESDQTLGELVLHCQIESSQEDARKVRRMLQMVPPSTIPGGVDVDYIVTSSDGNRWVVNEEDLNNKKQNKPQMATPRKLSD